MPTNLEFLCKSVLILNRPAFLANNSCNPTSYRRSKILADAYFLQPLRFPTAKSAVIYVPLISKSKENMGFVGNLSYMDVVLLVVLDTPTKPPRFTNLLSLDV